MTKDQHNTIRQCNFKSYLFRSEQARILFIELREKNSCISPIHIIHPLIAKEVLNQLSQNRPQSDIVNDLLDEKVLLQHRFGRDDFIKFIRDLFLMRDRKSRVEHNPEKAIKLLQTAYKQFDKDAFFAQQLARLHYMHEKFEEAKSWAETARRQLPGNSFILHTEGQVYKRWFNLLLNRKKNDLTPEDVIKLIELIAENAAKNERDSMNDSAFFGEVDVGCQLLQMLSSQLVFSKNREKENMELLKYLLTDYIPEEIEKPWFEYHSRLKGL
ncbi:unnamed protein product [Ranitomeya imitator]|uniref:Tetratricopeptide repeat protein n=1 Tax=Ranitomeya imitator TaxID=111125 RepID=A0ABN9MPN4_9NEOB|nr:unnamed protein product [Ranitomeya imitator]